MQVHQVGERIKVGAVFDDRRIIPKWFYWGPRKHEVAAVEHTWRSKEGEAPLVFFSVTDGANVFEIRFNLKTAEWMLERVYLEG